MRPMTPSEWLKYDWRLDLFLKKFREKEPFQLKNGKKVIFDYDPVVDKKIATKDRSKIMYARFQGSDGNIYKMSDIGKSSEFGGQGGGSGAGAKMTELVESAQCLYCAAAWYSSNFNDDSLKKAAEHVDVTVKIDKIIDDLPGSWKDSSVAVATKLRNEFNGTNYKFHRGSKWVDNIEKRFKLLNNREKEFSNVNKWSPADIYMLTSVGEKEDFSQANSLVELNAIILKHINNRDIIPISLKKVNPNNVTVKYINVDNNKSTYEIDQPYYTTGKKGFFNSKDSYMNFKEGEIQFRGFSTVNFQGEIKGKYAAHGKVGHGIINKYIKMLTSKSLESPRSVADEYKKDPKKLYEKFYVYYKALEDRPIKYDEFVNSASKKDLGWHVSKYIGVQMLYHISKAKKNTLDAFIGSLIGYAASESEMSAPFIKVS